MEKLIKACLLLVAALVLQCCTREVMEDRQIPENVVAFKVGNDAAATKSSSTITVSGAQVASYALGEVDGEELSLVETVSGMDSRYAASVVETKGTPVYTQNFDSMYGEQVYATAFEPKGGSVEYAAKDVWGSYLENGGTVKFNNIAGNTYSYDYSKGKTVNLGWPEDGELLYFIQAPYEKTSALLPKFYSNGSIQFDYTDPNPATEVGGRQTIVNGAAAQTDFLFTSKTVSKPAEAGTPNNILMYHSLTAVKFKAGNKPLGVGNTSLSKSETTISKVTIKGIKANGHCTINPNYADENTTAGGNASNANGSAGTKSSSCTVWTPQDTERVVDYSQQFSGTTTYTSENTNFASSFYANHTAENNYVLAGENAGEVMLLVPQVLENVEVVVDFTITVDGTPTTYQRSVKLNSEWKAGELHTYTLTVNKLDVTVDDDVNTEKTVKDNVRLINAGYVPVYMRASIAAAWYYGEFCVAAYEGNGHFYVESDSPWIEGKDGYFYYPWPVLPGYETEHRLFESFTAPTVDEEAPFPGAHLEMKILLQAVQCEYDPEDLSKAKTKVTAAWGDVEDTDGNKIVDQLVTEPERTN